MRRPNHPDVLFRQALTFHQSGRPEKALPIYRRLLELLPDDARLLFLIGSAESQRGNAAQALPFLERSLLADPLNADIHNNLGLALQALHRTAEALNRYDRAIALNPGSANAYINKGLVLREAGRFEEALECFERALDCDPDNAEQHNNRGNVLLDLGRTAEALASFDRAIALDPAYAEAYANRGSALQEAGRPTEALASFDRAIALNPRLAEAHNMRGDFLLSARREAEAKSSFERAYSLKPTLEFVFPRFVYSRLRNCDWDGIETQLARLEARISRGEQLCVPFDSLGLFGSLQTQRKVAQTYAHRKFPPRDELGPIPARQGDARIRIGYYSADYRDHATTRLMAELFELHDRRRFELVGFDFGPGSSDEMRKRVVAAFDRFVDVRAKSDHDIARLSRELRIDIAVDLKGFTEDCRPGIFAARAAPLQVSYLGYPGTMGAGYIDYIVADRVLIPAVSQAHYSEKVIYLPDSYQANDRKRSVSERRFGRQELGLPAEGFVFCCFNNNYKITPPVFDTWMRILRQVEGSVLWLIEDSASTAANLRRQAGKRGVSVARLVFAKRMPLPEHLARHRNADLFLDTLPYNAHTTASDALWSGLPVLTCAGEAFASRVAASLLTAVGLPELITTGAEEYEAIAVQLATDPMRLAQLRQKLEAHRLTAPLFDTPRFAGNLEAAYETIHTRHLTGLAPDHVWVTPAE